MTVPENVGDLVLQVVAIDDDNGDDGVLSYSIVNTTELLLQLLDEDLYSYVITVLVTDLGTPPKVSIESYSVVFIGTQLDIAISDR